MRTRPIAFGVLIANFPGGDMGVIQADENGMVMVGGVMKNIWEMPLHEIEMCIRDSIWTNGTVRKETTTLIPIRHLPP